MPLCLPAPIATYVTAANENLPNRAGQSFAIDATVYDEGQTFQGLTAIQRWMKQTNEKYQHTLEPLAYYPTSNGGVVTMRLAGNFPGSPIDVKFTFVLEGDRIASLDIRSCSSHWASARALLRLKGDPRASVTFDAGQTRRSPRREFNQST